jgi:hypothetical protein
MELGLVVTRLLRISVYANSAKEGCRFRYRIPPLSEEKQHVFDWM